MNTWHIVIGQTPTILGVFGEALLGEAQECARKIERETSFPAYVVQVKGKRPRVGDPAPKKRSVNWAAS